MAIAIHSSLPVSYDRLVSSRKREIHPYMVGDSVIGFRKPLWAGIPIPEHAAWVPFSCQFTQIGNPKLLAPFGPAPIPLHTINAPEA
jgi:hypothetical protein